MRGGAPLCAGWDRAGHTRHGVNAANQWRCRASLPQAIGAQGINGGAVQVGRSLMRGGAPLRAGGDRAGHTRHGVNATNQWRCRASLPQAIGPQGINGGAVRVGRSLVRGCSFVRRRGPYKARCKCRKSMEVPCASAAGDSARPRLTGKQQAPADDPSVSGRVRE